MGQIAKSQALTSYRDDDVASTSSAVPLQHQRYADEDVPPAYAEEADVFGVPQESRINGEPTLTRPSHVEGGSFGFKVHEDSKGSFTTYISDALSSDPEICQSLVERETQRSPIPMVRIIGSHVETRQRDKKEEKQRVTDFDVSAHMSGLLAAPWARSKVVENSQKTYRGGIVRQVDPRLKAHPEAANTPPSLKEWCHRFCASSASAKSYVKMFSF